MISKVTGVPIKDNGCSLKAYKANVIKNIPLYSEMHRFIPAMASLAGASVKQIEVKHHARKFGESKYGLTRIYKVAVDLISIKTILTFAERSSRWYAGGVLVAGSLSLASMIYGGTESVFYPGGTTIVWMGFSLLFAALALFLLFLGILSQLIRRSGHMNALTYSNLTAMLLGAKRDSDWKNAS